MQNQDLEELVIETARDVAQQSGGEIPDDLGSEVSLFGEEGIFDSLGLVTLIVAVEEAIQERFDVSVSLADERALSQSRSPFRTVGTLAAYAGALLKEVENDG
mgnify:CR=1 FL=1